MLHILNLLAHTLGLAFAMALWFLPQELMHKVQAIVIGFMCSMSMVGGYLVVEIFKNKEKRGEENNVL